MDLAELRGWDWHKLSVRAKNELRNEPPSLVYDDKLLKEIALQIAPRATQLLNRTWDQQTKAYQEHFHRIAVESIEDYVKDSRKVVTKVLVYQQLNGAQALKRAEIAFAHAYARNPKAVTERLAKFMAKQLRDRGMVSP